MPVEEELVDCSEVRVFDREGVLFRDRLNGREAARLVARHSDLRLGVGQREDREYRRAEPPIDFHPFPHIPVRLVHDMR